MSDPAEMLALLLDSRPVAPSPLERVGLTRDEVHPLVGRSKPGAAAAPVPMLVTPFTSRPAMLRLVRLAMLLRSGEAFNASTLAKECGTCRKTIARDLAFLRKQLGWSINFDPVSNRYDLGAKPPEPVL